MQWDPAQYARYADERARPFLDLIAGIKHDCPARIVDLGCGPGNLTEVLAARWPQAIIEGIDSSPEMIERARPREGSQLSFRLGDIATWDLPADIDVIVTNAALQWVPRHQELLRAWANGLAAGSWLALQVPGNFAAPSHALMRSIAASARWAPKVAAALAHHDSVGTPTSYATLLLDAGMDVDAWETTYLHRLAGEDAVLEWVRGTGLRPVLAALSDEDSAAFEQEYEAKLRRAYPAGRHGTLFPFRRVFAVAHKRF